MLQTSFLTRFLLFTVLVALMATIGGVLLRFVGQWLPEGAQAVVGA